MNPKEEVGKDTFFAYLGIAIAKFPWVSVILKKRRQIGFRGLRLIANEEEKGSKRLKTNNTFSTTVIQEWMTANFCEGGPDDSVSREEMWSQFKAKNASVTDDDREVFFSYMGNVLQKHPFNNKKKENQSVSDLQADQDKFSSSSQVRNGIDSSEGGNFFDASDLPETLDETPQDTIDESNHQLMPDVADHLTEDYYSSEDTASEDTASTMDCSEKNEDVIDIESDSEKEDLSVNVLEEFFEKFRKHVGRLVPSKLLKKFSSFQAYLTSLFPKSESFVKDREEIHLASGSTSVYADARIRAFIATCFPPVEVGSLAGDYLPFTFQGDIFPQFTHHGNQNVQCAICISYLKWAIQNQKPHSQCRSKKASNDAVLSGTARLEFSGLVQAREHKLSKCHAEAIEFFKRDRELTTQISSAIKEENVEKKDRPISSYFIAKKPLN